jgi:hypothetical protein
MLTVVFHRAQRMQVLYAPNESNSVDPITAALMAHGRLQAHTLGMALINMLQVCLT